MPGNDIADFFNGIPLVTRYWFSGTILFSLLGRFGIISPVRLVLLWSRIYGNFEIWRPITALLYYPMTPSTGFHFLLVLYFLYSYSSRLESELFTGRTADYVFLFLFCWISNVLVSVLTSFYILVEPMVYTILYIWSQVNRDVYVQFWFGINFKAMYFPWVLFAFNFILRESAIMELVGIIVGHLYYFLAFQYPQEYGGPVLLKTPDFLYRLFPSTRGGVRGFGQPPARRAAPSSSSSRFPGTGNVLGQDD